MCMDGTGLMHRVYGKPDYYRAVSLNASRVPNEPERVYSERMQL